MSNEAATQRLRQTARITRLGAHLMSDVLLSPTKRLCRAVALIMSIAVWAQLLSAAPTVAEANTPKSATADAMRHAEIKDTGPRSVKPAPGSAGMTIDQFLDLLMVAESGGNDNARNPLSTAIGAYQFIESTFLSVMQRHFPRRIEKLTTAQILALRTDRAAARDAAQAFTEDNASHLVAAGHKSTFPHLRLAFLLGPGGATRILDAKPETPLAHLLPAGVIRANPWMTRHTAASLIARSARDLSLTPTSLAGVRPRRDPITGKQIIPPRIASRHRIRVNCNLARPSCKRWLSLKRKALSRTETSKRTQRQAAKRFRESGTRPSSVLD